jgi:type IV pilus assembly protein PilC
MNESTRKYLPPEETAMFCEQVALILKSGIPLFDGIDALCQNYKDTKYGDKFKILNDKVRETGSLYEGLEAVGIFPPYMINTVKIGEQAGTVDGVMESMALYYTRENKIRSAVKNAITYPIVLIAMMALVVGVLVVKVLPIFTQVFRNLGTGMSASSVAIMNFGLAAGQTVLIIVCALIVIAGVLYLLTRVGKKEAVFAFIAKIFPPIRDLYAQTAAARFASVMAMMLHSGFPLETALSLIPDVLDDKTAKDKVAICQREMQQSEFPTAVEACGIFEGIYSKMVRVAFMAGQLDGVMEKLADIHNEAVDNGISRLVSLIEPTLVAILSIIIGAVLLAVMLPLASIMSSM